MLPVVWNNLAERDLIEILDYIATRNPAAADRMQDLFSQAVERLPEHPYLYRAGVVAGTREMVVHPNYILIYRVEVSEIRIVSVLHTRRQYP